MPTLSSNKSTCYIINILFLKGALAHFVPTEQNGKVASLRTSKSKSEFDFCPFYCRYKIILEGTDIHLSQIVESKLLKPRIIARRVTMPRHLVDSHFLKTFTDSENSPTLLQTGCALLVISR